MLPEWPHIAVYILNGGSVVCSRFEPIEGPDIITDSVCQSEEEVVEQVRRLYRRHFEMMRRDDDELSGGDPPDEGEGKAASGHKK